MGQISNVIKLLVLCATLPSFIAGAHTSHNAAKSAELRYAAAWETLATRMAPCLTPQNICQLSRQQLRALKLALEARSKRPMVLPVPGAISYEDGAPKSEGEILEAVLGVLQDCNYALEPESLRDIVSKALEVSDFMVLPVHGGEPWIMFQRRGLFIEEASGVTDLTGHFRSMLHLAPDETLRFTGLWSKNIAGMIEIGGRVNNGSAGESRFTMLIGRTKSGPVPSRVSLTVFQ